MAMASEADELDEEDDAEVEAEANGEAVAEKRVTQKRRATAQSMAAKQRDISVSEFFAKNRHLLGFDNPRKALLTTVKEAVDNSLDACEEAGILPEIWVHIEATGTDRFKVGIQDNGPGIVKKQIPLIFGKLLYGSKFHRLRQSRGQQGIGISAAGMYGVQTTGKPVKIVSKIDAKKPAHYFEIQIDTKKQRAEDSQWQRRRRRYSAWREGRRAYREKHGIEWVDEPHGTRVTIELQAKFIRGRGSVDEYLTQTAIANPHITLHYRDPDNTIRRKTASFIRVRPKNCRRSRRRFCHIRMASSLGRLVGIAHGQPKAYRSRSFLTNNFRGCRRAIARKICRRRKFRRVVGRSRWAARKRTRCFTRFKRRRFRRRRRIAFARLARI